MSHPAAHGVNRQGVDGAFEANEARKSQLLLQAQMSQGQQKPEDAADKFAEAAVIEERLRDLCSAQGLTEKALVHGFSAASCWAQAGDFHHAIVLCHELLTHAELPARLRQRIHGYVKTLCARRAEWYKELVLQDAEQGG